MKKFPKVTGQHYGTTVEELWVLVLTTLDTQLGALFPGANVTGGPWLTLGVTGSMRDISGLQGEKLFYDFIHRRMKILDC